MILNFSGASSVSGDSESTGTVRTHWSMVAFGSAGIWKQRMFDCERTLQHGRKSTVWPEGPDGGAHGIASAPYAVVQPTNKTNARQPEKRSLHQGRSEIRPLLPGIGRL